MNKELILIGILLIYFSYANAFSAKAGNSDYNIVIGSAEEGGQDAGNADSNAYVIMPELVAKGGNEDYDVVIGLLPLITERAGIVSAGEGGFVGEPKFPEVVMAVSPFPELLLVAIAFGAALCIVFLLYRREKRNRDEEVKFFVKPGGENAKL